MKWEFSFRVSLLSLCCLATVYSAPANNTTIAIETSTSTSEEPTEVTESPESEQWKHPTLCYIEKFKATELITRMNQTVQILNRGDRYLICNDNIESAIVGADDIKFCDDERISKVQKDLNEVTAELLQLAIRVSEPSVDEVNSLDLRKIQLVRELKVLRVFYGPSPCGINSIALYPFQPLVEYVEWNLDQVFVLFQTPRPTRSPQETTTIATLKPRVMDEKLRPDKSFEELVEMARVNPAAMSKSIPKIISQRYNGRDSTFDSLLRFVEDLPTTENQILGFAAVRDEMARYNPNPEPIKLTKLATSVRRLNGRAAETVQFLGEAARSKLTGLLDDPDLNLLILLLDPQRSYQELTEIAVSNPSAMSDAIPEIVSQRYNATSSAIGTLLDFVEVLPTTENKIFGFAAMHKVLVHNNSEPNPINLAKLANSVRRFNETASSTIEFVDKATRDKFFELLCDPDLNTLNLLLNPRRSYQELTELARLNPFTMSKAIPEIVSQRYNSTAPLFDRLFNFIRGLQTTENKILGLNALHAEMFLCNPKPDPINLAKLANSMQEILEDTPTNTTSLEAARSKLTGLLDDPVLNPLILMLNPQRSYEELAKMARLKPSAMSEAISEIVLQRYHATSSVFESLLKFVEVLPTTENKIFGFVAMYHEMVPNNNSEPNPINLAKLANSVRRLNETAALTMEFVDKATQDTFFELLGDPNLNHLNLLLHSQRSYQELLEIARSNTSAMSNALPEIVSQRYNSNMSNFEVLFEFIENLPTLENQIFAVAAVEDEMTRRHNQSLGLDKQWRIVAKSVQRLNESELTKVDKTAKSKLADLVNDDDLRSLIMMLNPENSFADLNILGQSNPFAMFNAIPEIVSKRYNSTAPLFDHLLNFIRGLATTENKFFGLNALHDEMFLCNPKPDPINLAKLANSMQEFLEGAATTTKFNEAARSKLTGLVNDPTLKPLILLLNPQRSYKELAKLARSKPSAMSNAIPEIVSQRYNANSSVFGYLLDFVEVLPTTENKILGFDAMYKELVCNNSKPNPINLAKLANCVIRLNETAAATMKYVENTTRDKFLDLLGDLDSKTLSYLRNPQRSYQELAELARLNPSTVSKAISEVVSQRYNPNISNFEVLFEFIENLPALENQIFGVAAVQDEMTRRHNKSLGLDQQWRIVAKSAQRLNEPDLTKIEREAKSKLADLSNDDDLSSLIIMLNPEKSFADLNMLARANPFAMSNAITEIVSQRYNTTASPFDHLFNFIGDLPTTENKIFGFSAVYDEMRRYNRRLNLKQLMQLAASVKQLSETAATSVDDEIARLKLADLAHHLRPLILTGEKAECYIANVAYQRHLHAQDYSSNSPYSAYLYSDPNHKWVFRIYPNVKDDSLVFRILGVSGPFYAFDINPNPYTSIKRYQTKSSERYVLYHFSGALPTNAELDWKLVPIENKTNQFKILSAKFDDFMFAHQSATGYGSWRHVLLGRKSYSSHDHIADADKWTFDCKPGTYAIPTS